MLKQYKELFKLDESVLSFKDNALKEIAQKAISKTGARRPQVNFENIFVEAMYDLPSQII